MTPSPPRLVSSGYAGAHQLAYESGSGVCNSCGPGCGPHGHVAQDDALFGAVWDYRIGAP
jgi:hypothetical protein